MGNLRAHARHAVPTSPPRFRRSDRALRRTAAAAASALLAISIAGAISSVASSTRHAQAVVKAAAEAPVLVTCSDGTCAVPPSTGQVRTVTIRWVHPAPVAP